MCTQAMFHSLLRLLGSQEMHRLLNKELRLVFGDVVDRRHQEVGGKYHTGMSFVADQAGEEDKYTT
jgi:hypothetical protein